MVDGPRGVPPPETQRIYKRNAGIGVVLKGMGDALKRRAERNAKRHMRHSGPFHDGHGVFRKPNGKFAKETAPKHKRPPRIPWEKEGRNWKRKQAKERHEKS